MGRRVALALTLVLSLALVGMGETVLRATITATPESLDPAVALNENEWKVAVSLYDFLVYPAREDGSPLPSLATSWEVSDDSLVWTFHLREGVTFHDGTELTAEDVKFSMDRMIAIGEGNAHFFIGRVAETRVIDPYTVQFILSEPFGPFLVTLYRFGIVSKDLVMANLQDGMYGDYGDYAKDYLITHDGGSGPYVATEFKIRDSVTMEKFAGYWEGVAEDAPDKVVMTQLLEAATTKMLMGSGEVDLVHGRQEMATLEALLATDDVEQAPLPEMAINFFMINTKKPPTDDVHVRRAMAYATDYDGMIDIYPGSDRALGPVPPQVFGYAEDLEGYTRNLELAKEELKKSRYYGELDKYPIELSYIQGNGDTAKLAMLFAVNMQEIGLRANIVEAPWVLFCNKEETLETSPHVTNLFASCSYPEAGSILELKYASWTVGGWNQNEWLQDPTFDAAIQEALTTVDPDKRAELYAEMQHYLVEDVCPSIFTFVSVLKPAYRSDRFTWPAGEGNPHAILEFNFNMKDFRMQQ